MTTIRRSERALWEAARTLQDLADLTAGWLRGEIASQPGYYGRVDVDEGDAPGMAAALVACNRAGFWTRNSQAGYDGPGSGGDWWTQVAAVTGYATPEVADRIVEAVARAWVPWGTPLRVQDVRAVRGRYGDDWGGVTVTWRAGEPYTHFGDRLSRRELAFTLDGCCGQAVGAVATSRCLLIWDPLPGRNTMWAWLTATMPGLASGGLAVDPEGGAR